MVGRVLVFILFLLTASFGYVPEIHASSLQAYRDYQYQYDVYRQRVTDFRVSYTQFKQFNSLASQQRALDTLKLLLTQRELVAKTYFLFLNEKITENPGLVRNDASLYRTIVANHIGSLDRNSILIPSVGSFEDAQNISERFETNYEAMQSSFRQTIIALELGYLNYFARRLNENTITANALIAAAKTQSVPEKQEHLDRWLLTLTNKQNLYQQKMVEIGASLLTITGDIKQQDRVFIALKEKVGTARQDLVEAASYLKEIQTALQYD